MERRDFLAGGVAALTSAGEVARLALGGKEPPPPVPPVAPSLLDEFGLRQWRRDTLRRERVAEHARQRAFSCLRWLGYQPMDIEYIRKDICKGRHKADHEKDMFGRWVTATYTTPEGKKCGSWQAVWDALNICLKKGLDGFLILDVPTPWEGRVYDINDPETVAQQLFARYLNGLAKVVRRNATPVEKSFVEEIELLSDVYDADFPLDVTEFRLYVMQGCFVRDQTGEEYGWRTNTAIQLGIERFAKREYGINV